MDEGGGVANALLAMWFFFRNPTFSNGGDEVFRLTSLYLALASTAVGPGGRSLSRDRAVAVADGDAESPATVPAWTLRMVQIQIALVYFVAGFWKVLGAPWWDGSAIQYALGNSAFSRFGAPEWAWVQPVFAAATIVIASAQRLPRLPGW